VVVHSRTEREHDPEVRRAQRQREVTAARKEAWAEQPHELPWGFPQID
jgi:hypothetical protein